MQTHPFYRVANVNFASAIWQRVVFFLFLQLLYKKKKSLFVFPHSPVQQTNYTLSHPHLTLFSSSIIFTV